MTSIFDLRINFDLFKFWKTFEDKDDKNKDKDDEERAPSPPPPVPDVRQPDSKITSSMMTNLNVILGWYDFRHTALTEAWENKSNMSKVIAEN